VKAVRFVVAAACFALAPTFINTSLRAGEVAPPPPTDNKKTTEVTPPPAPAPEAQPAPLMGLMDQEGFAAPLKKAGINIYGYIEGGYMYDATTPHNRKGPTFMGFNNLKNTPILDKVSLNFERTVDPAKKKLDVGFHIEGIYGFDAAFIHSNGMFDNQTDRNQGDLLQAYVDVAFPGVPVKLRMGKWIELAGFEQFSANIYGAFGDPARALYSYSYQFLYAEPGTQTGAFLTWVVNPKITVDAGFTLGWNQSIEKSNDMVDFLSRVTYAPSDKTSIVFVMTEGPEFPTGVGPNLPHGDNSHTWTALDLAVTHKMTEKLSLGFGVDYVETARIHGLTGGAKQWGGLAGYVSHALDSRFTLNSRVEWYNDSAKGFPTGAPVSAHYYEATLGVAIKPLPKRQALSHLLFRPEVRYDRSDHRIFDSGHRDQVIFGVDALFTF
jgi:hypothetical protein